MEGRLFPTQRGVNLLLSLAPWWKRKYLRWKYRKLIRCASMTELRNIAGEGIVCVCGHSRVLHVGKTKMSPKKDVGCTYWPAFGPCDCEKYVPTEVPSARALP